VERLRSRGIRLCIGSDSNVRIDPLEELRELEGIARRQSGRRNVLTIETLLAVGSAEGAAALGLDGWPDVTVNTDAPCLRGIDDVDLRAALLLGCAADALAPVA
jgi:cytosine/adenosine deaminase-related metal-dependent hydrolase